MDLNPPQTIKPARRKVHIVYYLSRASASPSNGLDHPHLIEGYINSSQEGVRLRDVKRWLAVLRGKGMPNSYAWSYKRNYKNGFIWHDLGDHDIIQPLCKNEYVLMGSEIKDMAQGRCKCGGASTTVAESRKCVEGSTNGESLEKQDKVNVVKCAFAERKSGPAVLEAGFLSARRGLNPTQSYNTTPLNEIKSANHSCRSPCQTFSLTARQLLEEIKRPNRTRSTRSMQDLEEREIDEILDRQHQSLKVNVMEEYFDARSGQLSMVEHSKSGAGALRKVVDVEEGLIMEKDDGTNNMDAATQTGDSTRGSSDQDNADSDDHQSSAKIGMSGAKLRLQDQRYYVSEQMISSSRKGSPMVIQYSTSGKHRLSTSSSISNGERFSKELSCSNNDNQAPELKAMIVNAAAPSMGRIKYNVELELGVGNNESSPAMSQNRVAGAHNNVRKHVQEPGKGNVATGNCSSNERSNNYSQSTPGPVMLKHLLSACGGGGDDLPDRGLQGKGPGKGNLSNSSSNHSMKGTTRGAEEHVGQCRYSAGNSCRDNISVEMKKSGGKPTRWSCKPGSLNVLMMSRSRRAQQPVAAGSQSDARSVQSGHSDAASSACLAQPTGRGALRASPDPFHDQRNVPQRRASLSPRSSAAASPAPACSHHNMTIARAAAEPPARPPAGGRPRLPAPASPRLTLPPPQQRHGGNSSPGTVSACSSRRSSIREQFDGGDIEEGFKEAFRNAMGGTSRTSTNGDQYSSMGANLIPRRNSTNGDQCSSMGLNILPRRRQEGINLTKTTNSLSQYNASSTSPCTILSLSNIASPHTRNNDFQHIICSPCVPNIISPTLSKHETNMVEPPPRKILHHYGITPSSSMIKLSNGAMDSPPSSILVEGETRGAIGGSSSWRDFLWSPRYSSFHKDKEKRRMKP